MNKPTVKLLRLFKRLHPSSARPDCNKACYSTVIIVLDVPIHHEFKFWFNDDGGRLMLYMECAYTNKSAIPEQEKLDDIAKIAKFRDELCAICPRLLNKDACRVCHFCDLGFEEGHAHFTIEPRELKDFAEVGFHVRDFQEMACVTFNNIVIGTNTLILKKALKEAAESAGVPGAAPAFDPSKAN